MTAQGWWKVVGGSALTLTLLAVGTLVVLVAAGDDGPESGSFVAAPGDDADCDAVEQQSASLQQIRLTTLSGWIEFEVRSTEPFHMRALPYVLAIGSHSFDHYRYRDDGRLDTLIFQIPFEDFAQLNQGDPVGVYYGSGLPFGSVPGATGGESEPTVVAFEKRLLDCPISEPT